MKIAVIGSGIAGMGAAYALSDLYEVHLFENETRFGGHANTLDVAMDGRRIAVDTGFIVFNRRNYPNLCGLFETLGVTSRPSDMSFGFSARGGRLEWAGDDLNRVFAQRRNLANPRFIRGVLDILRFNRTARAQLERGGLAGLTLGQWLARERFSSWFRDCYVLPMGGAIWSMPTAAMLEFPAESFVAFWHNHDLLSGLEDRQRWLTIDGGSRRYVTRLIARLGGRAHAGCGARAVRRVPGGVELRLADGSSGRFDHVILACHGPQAAALLADPDPEERRILGAFRTSRNRAILHSDPALMPCRRRVWSSWNFLSEGPDADRAAPAPVTYWMNRLQGIASPRPLFVSLNPGRPPHPSTVHADLTYAHPVMDRAAFDAQRAIHRIQGRGGVWYAGAWLGYGFHEDGLRSGLGVAARLGAVPAWARDVPEAGLLATRAAE